MLIWFYSFFLIELPWIAINLLLLPSFCEFIPVVFWGRNLSLRLIHCLPSSPARTRSASMSHWRMIESQPLRWNCLSGASYLFGGKIGWRYDYALPRKIFYRLRSRWHFCDTNIYWFLVLHLNFSFCMAWVQIYLRRAKMAPTRLPLAILYTLHLQMPR